MPDTVPSSVAWLAVVPFIGLAIEVAIHALLSRAFFSGAHVRIQFAAIGIGVIFVLALLASILSRYPLSSVDKTGYLLLFLSVYLCLGFCLFNVINANVSSLRVRMLKEYLSSAPSPVADDEISRRYSAAEILSVRLERLQCGGQIKHREDRYYAALGGVTLIGKFLQALRWLLFSARSASRTDRLSARFTSSNSRQNQ